MQDVGCPRRGREDEKTIRREYDKTIRREDQTRGRGRQRSPRCKRCIIVEALCQYGQDHERLARLMSEDLGGKDEDARNAIQYMYTPCQDGQDHRRAAQSMPEDPYAGKDEDTRGSTMQFNRKTKAKNQRRILWCSARTCSFGRFRDTWAACKFINSVCAAEVIRWNLSDNTRLE